ncbi:unnamed protein product [Ambrosiozyma monospora]|uniref:Unnamed protein product n=1 Tax=Ambrosiozyma monospora TaxID=43982 RepID=A0ACB5T9A6_AMBMO|nr:unnamed protein product [Ambrosiozyma monospora]
MIFRTTKYQLSYFTGFFLLIFSMIQSLCCFPIIDTTTDEIEQNNDVTLVRRKMNAGSIVALVFYCLGGTLQLILCVYYIVKFVRSRYGAKLRNGGGGGSGDSSGDGGGGGGGGGGD